MPNVVASPRQWKRKAILIKLESAVGTDSVPTGAANWIEARNVEFTPYEGDTVERNIEMPYFGNGGTLPTGKYASLSFQVAIVGSGATGDAPLVAPLLLACGFVEEVDPDEEFVAYSLTSENIASVTAYINIDGALHKMTGVRGTMTMTLSAQQIPLFQFNLQAVYDAPAAAALPAVSKGGWQVEQPVGSATTSGVTIGEVALAYSELSIDLSNQISRLDLPGPQREMSISNRTPTGSITVLAPALGVFNPFALADAGNTLDLTTTQDSRAGYQVQIGAKVRILQPSYAQIEDQVAYALNLELAPVAGNDELKLTYS
ncbi:MAG: hypothetical protein LBJ59_12075 [Zoogloeaceae bacterium]|jgi:hypothetical protein|nr:hypothetical protein [Zoogloeaceae bacterium]